MDISAAGERLAVGVHAPHRELAAVTTTLTIERWDAEQTAWAQRRLHVPEWHTVSPHEFGSLKITPYSVTRDENCNLLTLAGWAAMLGGIAGTSITNKFSATFGRIGVGTSSTAATASDTTLGGDTGSSSTTSYFQLVSGAPTIATGSAPATLTLSASFGNSVANFAWNEFGSDNYNASGVTATGLGAGLIFINHGISSQGTKASGQTWTATETISFGYPSGSGTVS